MFLEAIHHDPYGAYAFPLDGNHLKVRLRAKQGDLAKVTLLHSDRYTYYEDGIWEEIELERVAATELHDYFEGVITSKTRRVRYLFHLSDGQRGIWYGERGFALSITDCVHFQYAYINEADLFIVPDWVKEGIVYQIFPERFANGNPALNPTDVEPWGGIPAWNNFFGGDLIGVTEKLDYLQDLGVNVLYFTPIFLSPSNHKYNTTDYYQVDPHFGTLEDLKHLVKEAHRRDMRVILDAVFNHCGSQFFAFQDVIKKGKSSKYWDWFFIYDEPVIETPYPNYETFANGVSIMPKLNTQNPEVVAYLLNVARYWIEEADIDGWRLDVANEVDQAFWRQFRKVVKESKKDALIIGEVFHNSNPWLQGDQFDAVMNYIFRDALYDFFAKGKIGVSQFHERLTQLQMMYKDQAHLGMFNLIGSHDTERFLTACSEKEERMKLAVLFQMTYTGMPMIYYGDEIGMVGQNDPDCRRTFIWEEEKQNRALLDWYKRLIKIRKQNHALTHGSFRAWAVEETKQVYGMVRGIELPEPVGILLNNSPMKHELLLNVPWKREGSMIDALTGQEWRIDDHSLQISLMPYQGVILLHK